MKFYPPFFLAILVFFLMVPVPSSAIDSRGPLPGNVTSTPVLFIDNIPVHCVNELFTITGSTSLPAGTRLRVSIGRGSDNPGIPPQKNPWYDALQKETRVVPGLQQENTWTYTLNTSGSYADEYLVTVETYIGNEVNATAIFNLDETCNTPGGAAGTPGNTPARLHSPPVRAAAAPTQKSAEIPFLVALMAFGSFGIVLFLTSRK
jgi:hypothetical protein